MTRKILADAGFLCEELHRRVRDAKGLIGFDSESSGPRLLDQRTLAPTRDFINVYRSTMTGTSYYFPEDDTAFYLPVRHDTGNAPEAAHRDTIQALASRTEASACHSLKHELRVFGLEGADLEHAPIEDSFIIAWLLNYHSDSKKHPLGLKELAKKYLGMEWQTFRELVGDRETIAQVSPVDTLDYACADAIAAYKLVEKFAPDMSKYPGMKQAYRETELPFVRVLRHQEDTGMCIDPDMLSGFVEEWGAELEPLKAEWDFYAPTITVNNGWSTKKKVKTRRFKDVAMSISSGDQLQCLYERGDWSTVGVERTDTGVLSTSSECMKTHALHAPTALGRKLAAIRSRFQTLDKLRSTYGLKMVALAAQYPDGRLHCNFNHAGAHTGRVASSYPNLLNIPARSEEGRRIREAFPAPPGLVVHTADLSQIELRVAAGLTGKGKMFDAMNRGEDVDLHAEMGAMLGSTRDVGKTGNFTIVFGGGAAKLARASGCSLERAKEILARLWEENSDIAETKDSIIQRSRARGYARTISGRISRLPGLNLDGYSREQRSLRSYAERRAVSVAFQGTARDIMVRAQVAIYLRTRVEGGWRGEQPAFCNMIYDDLMSYVSPDDTTRYSVLVKEEMKRAGVVLRVPIVVDPKSGPTWRSVK